MDDRAIGVFDSGLGGLTVVSKLIERYPDENYIYVADTKRNPYGEKSKEEIIDYALEISNYLISRNVKMIIIACNTASAYAYDILKEKFNIPIYSILNSGVKLIDYSLDNTILLATQATVGSGVYQKEIRERGLKNIRSIACPDIVLAIEEGETDKQEKKKIIRKYMSGLQSYDQILLGCTHYPIWMEDFKSLYPDKLILDPAVNIIKEIEEIMINKDKNNIFLENEILVTGNLEKFKSNLSQLSSIDEKLKDFQIKNLDLDKI